MLTKKIDLTHLHFRQSTMKLGPDNSTVEVEVVLGRRLIGGFLICLNKPSTKIFIDPARTGNCIMLVYTP